MSNSLVKLTIDGVELEVPSGTLITDAAKQIGIDIPVFCYHPKLHPVGMCRMCLVEIGRPKWDRAKGEYVRDEKGDLIIEFNPKLETSCNTPVGEGWVIRVNSEKAREGRNQIVEYLLTSHPLDCPICDKGGECPLQNLTMAHGPGKSRFLLDEKMHLAKHVPLGELIYLDRERCIQCSRCVRFQSDLVDDPVIGFGERGRQLEIVTYSKPGFDSYFSGNTTDICPVGALTTADFRFGARPWELNAVASLCTHCPVGCNTMLNVRREAKADGRMIVKRVMPRQNEAVNEIWICDKGRFGHHYAGNPDRIVRPLVRKSNKLVETTWEEAWSVLETKFNGFEGKIVGLGGGRASNEDLFNLRSLIEGLGGETYVDSPMGGGDMVQLYGLTPDSSLGDLGAGDAILVVASDLHEAAPVWWMRLKAAAERGAVLIVANARPTRLDKFAQHSLQYEYGQAPEVVLGLAYAASGDASLKSHKGAEDVQATGKALAEAENVVVFFGGEGLDLDGSQALAEACALLSTRVGSLGKDNNGLVAVWPQANTQGAWDMGLRPAPNGLVEAFKDAKAAYIVASDPARGNPTLTEALKAVDFVVVQELYLTDTAKAADVVLPVRSYIEREGTLTSGDRRVQRYYMAVEALDGDLQPDYRLLSELGRRLEVEVPQGHAAAVMLRIAEAVPDYADLTYQSLAEVEPQWPHVGDDDLYFGGTAFKNAQGLGKRVSPSDDPGQLPQIEWSVPTDWVQKGKLLAVPVAELYATSTTLLPSELLAQRMVIPELRLNPGDAKRLKLDTGLLAEVSWDGYRKQLLVVVDENAPEGVVLMPYNSGAPLVTPQPVELKVVR
jgi:NADH-quinone oxidoreductase subunit G